MVNSMPDFLRPATLRQTLYGLARLLVDVLFPPTCPSCREPVAADGNFCGACFAKLRIIDAPICACCGIPFVIAVEPDTRCPECLTTKPDFDVARSALVYDAVSAPLITALKFNDQWAGLERYVQMMQRIGQPLFIGADLLVPVPLHWRRLLRRRFNQSALLAYGLSARTGIACAPHLLQRAIYTKPQMKLAREERLRNVKRAFCVHMAAAASVQGKTIILVDDVVTTGATAEACARALKAAGANEVRVLSLARTVKE